MGRECEAAARAVSGLVLLCTHWLAREEDALNTISSSSLARLDDLTNLGPRDTREKVCASFGAIYFTS